MTITLDGTTGVTAPALTGPVDASNLTGALPAIDGSAVTALTASNLTGALPAIDGSALTGINTTPTTAQVLTATAGATSGAVGTYAWLVHATANTSWSDGASIAGSALYKTTISRDGNTTNAPYRSGSSNGTPSGTWMALTTQYGIANYYPAGLFLRIA